MLTFIYFNIYLFLTSSLYLFILQYLLDCLYFHIYYPNTFGLFVLQMNLYYIHTLREIVKTIAQN